MVAQPYHSSCSVRALGKAPVISWPVMLSAAPKGQSHMRDKPLPIDQVLTLLASAPPRIAACTVDLTPAQLRTAPNPDEWSANDVLAHLRSCSDMWGKAIEVILAEDEPTIRAVNPRTWIKSTDYHDLE